MPDRTEHTASATSRGPWPEATDDRVFDLGAVWCVNNAGHPKFDIEYPDAARHVPTDECRTQGLFVDAVMGLGGPVCDLEIYGARSYRFGAARDLTPPTETRVMFDLFSETASTEERFSVSRGDALRLALHLIDVVRVLDSTRA